ncbi:MAG: CotH kinase family protein [Melioribacteraceae bacterium]|nr:CotH kinase family protein [Melioribacteraceae bacterium]
MKKIFLLFLICISNNLLLSQTNDKSWMLFDDTNLLEVRITMDKNAFDWMMANPLSDSMHVCSVKLKNKHFDSTLTNVAIRIRGNTSRTAQKKSFKISFNTFQKGREFYDVEKLNLNGEHNDPSIARSKLSWNLFQKNGFIASRANHALVYINNTFMGVYINVENIDDEFLKKRFGDDSGYLFKCLYGASLAPGSNNYEPETHEENPDFSQLNRLIKILDQTPLINLPDSLEKILCVDEFLKYEAMNVLIGQWDDYWSNMNNYYLYFDTQINKFRWIPYDYDNTFGIDWFNVDWAKVNPYTFYKIDKSKRPLIEKLFSIAQYRDLYTHFLQFIKEKTFQYYMLSSEAYKIKGLIQDYVLKDSYRRKDYGFTDEDFENSYGSASYQKLHVKKGILQFVNERNEYFKNSVVFSYYNSPPIVYKIDYEPKNPGPNDSIKVIVSAFASAGIENINIQFHPGLLTVIYFYKMKYSGNNSTTKVDEFNQWVGVIPPLGKNGFGRFKVEVKDRNGISMLYPRSEFINLKTKEVSTDLNKVLINELMADNTKTIKDPSNTSKDEYDDWVELYNPTENEIDLSGYFLTDDPTKLNKWKIPNIKIKSKEHLLFWCDEQETQTGLHTNFKLSKSGEYIALVSKDGKTIIDDYTFGAQQSDISFGRIPSGGTVWNFMNPTPGKPNVTTNIQKEEIPGEFNLYQNFPNPFNPETTISYQIPISGITTLKIFDLLGNEIATLVNEYQNAGFYRYQFSINKYQLTSGIYFYQLKNGNFVETKKMIIVK